MTGPLTIESRGAVDWLTLNRPKRLNALDSDLIAALSDYFARAATRRETRVIVLRGAGRGFCAGFDLVDDLGAMDTIGRLDLQRSIAEIVMRMRYCPQPIVSLIHGPACGGGFALALASDIRLAGESTRMNAAFFRVGLSACDIGVSYLLPRLVGASVAAELMLTGAFIDAARASSLGLVSRLVADDALEEAALPIIDAMLTTAPLGLRLTKECLRMSIDAPSLEHAIAMEDRNQVLCSSTSDFSEGVAAFFDKRRPAYASPLEARA
ncbi:enoyl-CoA hydratase/isomerase family protein [uncultured Sphingomonas sp.]|uniref:enoyl-CoA hydratase/isomerase family protein n=1 Tax=uncultured Sphingomonas sp. TaxID=158754 RepID=UPI0035CB6B31